MYLFEHEICHFGHVVGPRKSGMGPLSSGTGSLRTGIGLLRLTGSPDPGYALGLAMSPLVRETGLKA